MKFWNHISVYNEPLSTCISGAFPANSHTPDLYEPAEYLLQLGGKRLRPALALLACELVNGDFNPALPFAAGVEIFHNFTLMHDDIMDQAPIRRGLPTVHTKYNLNTAILSGDAMFTVACKEVMKSPVDARSVVMSHFLQTALEVCEGQQMDMRFETLEQVSVDEYIEMIRLKTSVLLAEAARCGALCGGADAMTAHWFYDYALTAGIAFQIQDDILDAYGDPEKVGKQPGGDILSAKKTLLMLTAFERGGKEEILNILASSTTNQEKVARVLATFDHLEVRQAAEHHREAYFKAACKALDAIQQTGINTEMLKEIADFFAHREF